MPRSLPAHLPARVLRLAIPCEVAAMRQAVKSVRGFLASQGLPAADLDGWELALGEAGNNAVLHTPARARRRPIGLTVLCDPEQVEMHLTDRTPGFDWPEQVRLPDALSEHGRGLYMIRHLTDTARYYRGPRENCLILQRRREDAPTATEGKPEAETLRGQVRELELTLAGMTEELASCYESLSAIFQFSGTPAASGDLGEFARHVLSHLMKIAGAEWFVLRLWERERNALRPFVVSQSEVVLPPLALSAAPARASAEAEAAAQRQDVWLDATRLAAAAEPLRALPPITTGLIHPFFLNDELVGTLSLGRAAPAEPFTAAQVNVIHTFSDFLALQLMSRRYKDHELKARLATRELEIAAEIQNSLVPGELPQPGGLSVAGYCRSARQVGGDYYDVVGCGDEGLFVVIADVMGKGLPAAMLAAILRAVVRSQAHLYGQPARLLQRMNEVMFADLDRLDMFITAQVLFLDTRRHGFRTAGAGHCLPLLYQPARDQFVAPAAGGLPLGVNIAAPYTEDSHLLEPRDILLLHTDGLSELQNRCHEFLGVEGLRAWLRQAGGQPSGAADLQRDLLRRLKEFQGDAAVSDDQTFVLVRDERP